MKLLYGIGIGGCKSRVRNKGFIKLLDSRCFKCYTLYELDVLIVSGYIRGYRSYVLSQS